jgi:hypothetical protein
LRDFYCFSSFLYSCQGACKDLRPSFVRCVREP